MMKGTQSVLHQSPIAGKVYFYVLQACHSSPDVTASRSIAPAPGRSLPAGVHVAGPSPTDLDTLLLQPLDGHDDALDGR